MKLPSKETAIALVIVGGFLLLVVHLMTAPASSADPSAHPTADPSADQPSTVDNSVIAKLRAALVTAGNAVNAVCPEGRKVNAALGVVSKAVDQTKCMQAQARKIALQAQLNAAQA